MIHSNLSLNERWRMVFFLGKRRRIRVDSWVIFLISMSIMFLKFWPAMSSIKINWRWVTFQLMVHVCYISLHLGEGEMTIYKRSWQAVPFLCPSCSHVPLRLTLLGHYWRNFSQATGVLKDLCWQRKHSPQRHIKIPHACCTCLCLILKMLVTAGVSEKDVRIITF